MTNLDLTHEQPLDDLMERVEAGEADAIEEWRVRMEAREGRFIAAMGRQLHTTRAMITQARDAYAAVMADYDAAIARLVEREAALVDALKSMALATRAADEKRKSIIVPYIGKVSTKFSPGRPSIPEPEVVTRWLHGDERERYLEPQPDRLKAGAVLADLKVIAEAHGVSERDIPGVKWGDDATTAKVENV